MHARQGAREEELIVSDNEKEGNYPKEKIPREESMISQSVSQSLLFYSALLQFVVRVQSTYFGAPSRLRRAEKETKDGH